MLQENEVVIVYYSDDADSLGIKNYYLTKYPNVISFDLDATSFHYEPYPGGDHCTSVPADSGLYATQFLISQKAYEDWIETPLRDFIQSHNVANDPDILAIVTTRGVPGVISNHRAPCRTHFLHHIKGSVESRLASLGHKRQGAWVGNPQDCTIEVVCDGEGGTSTGVNNPFWQETGVAYRAFAANECFLTPLPNGDTLLPLYLVTRLDAEHPDTDVPPDGIPIIPDEFAPAGLDEDDLECASRLEPIKALIDRGYDLRSGTMKVNPFLATIVVDNHDGDGYLSGNWMDHLRFNGFCVYEDVTPDFLDGALEYEIETCDAIAPQPGNPLVPGWHYGVEEDYTGNVVQGRYATELAHIGWGENHWSSGGAENDLPKPFHEMAFLPHSAGYYLTIESWAGMTSRVPGYLWDRTVSPPVPDCGPSPGLDSQSINWIAAGGSFTTYAVKGARTRPNSRSRVRDRRTVRHRLDVG